LTQRLSERQNDALNQFMRGLYGDEGSLDFGTGLTLRDQEEPISIDQLSQEYMGQLSDDEKDRLFPLGLQDPVAQEIHEFVEACLRGSGLETDGMEGYKAQAVCLGVYESAALNGVPLELSQIEDLRVEAYQAALNEKIGV